MLRSVVTVGMAVLGVLLGSTGCGPCRRTEPAAGPEAPPPPAPPTLGITALLQHPHDVLPADVATVWWTVRPTGAVVRIAGERDVHVVTAATERVGIPLRTDFYDVDVTHPDHRPWSRRMALGGSATNHVISLRRAPPPPAEPLVSAPAPAAEPPAPPPPPPRRELTLEALLAEHGATPRTEAAGDPPRPGKSLALLEPETTRPVPPAEPPPAEPDPLASLAAAEPVERPLAAPPAEEPLPAPPVASAATRPHVPSTPPTQPTRVVRIQVDPATAADAFLPSAVKHLHIGRHDLRAVPELTLELPYDEIGSAPLRLRIQRYEVEPPTLIAPPEAPRGVATLTFRAFPHPASVSLSGAPAQAEVWHLAESGERSLLGPVSRLLWIAPFQTHRFEIRARGLQVLPLELSAAAPGLQQVEPTLRLIPPPFTGRPGAHCRVDLGGGIDLDLIWVPGGPIVLRDPRAPPEAPDIRHDRIAGGFWMSRTVITREQWHAVKGRPDGRPAGDGQLPMTNIPWTGASAFAQRLNQTWPAGVVRLPTEAEWEQAARAGTPDPWGGMPQTDIWHGGQPGPRRVSDGAANAWNLLDLCGNVREWTADTFRPYRGGAAAMPGGIAVRGGGFRSTLADCRVDVREALRPDQAADDLGFRVIYRATRPPRLPEHW